MSFFKKSSFKSVVAPALMMLVTVAAQPGHCLVQEAAPAQAPRIEKCMDEAAVFAGRKALEQAVMRSLDKQDRQAQFFYFMDQFEKRASGQGIASAQVSATYSELESLLSSSDETYVSRKHKIWLAEQVIRQAARPTSINQGKHNTCAVTALESRIYTLKPSVAARLIKEVATMGQFTAADSTPVVLDACNLDPDNEALANPPGYGKRSFASQLFQLTAVNAYWQRCDKDPRGIKVKPGQISYLQVSSADLDGPSDTGERLVINWDSEVKETVVEDNGFTSCHPSFNLAQVKQVSERITGVRENDFLITNGKYTPSAGAAQFRSEDSLRAALTRLGAEHSLPAIIAVNTGSRLFGIPAMAGQSGWHAVNVTDFDPASGKVSVDNWWGEYADLTGDRAVELHDLYLATCKQSSSSPLLSVR